MQKIHYQKMYDLELTHWWYRVRREMVHVLLKQYKSKSNHTLILDVGCGTGALMKELEVYGEVHGIDFSEEAIDFCKSRGITNVKKSGIEKIPYSDGSFDVVLALDVLEHVPNDNMGISEIYRVLKPGGVVIIFVPAFNFLWGVTDVISQHYRRYTKKEIIRKVTENNFVVLETSYFNFLLFVPIYLVRLFVNYFNRNSFSEISTGSKLINITLYYIFHFESLFLSKIRFPFGVSCRVVAHK